MKTNTILRKGLVLAMTALVSFNALADECLSDWWTKNNTYVANKYTKRVTQTEAGQWEDWIWQGPIFFCTDSPGTGDCVYRWDQTHYSEYSFAVGLELSLSKVPVLGKYIGEFGFNGTATKLTGWSETYSWSQEIKKDWYARPVKIIYRRWSTGVFQGGLVARPWTECNGGQGTWYRWDSNAKFGGWKAQMETGRFARYHVWQRGT